MTQVDARSDTAERLQREHLIVEGHRDCYEQIYRLNQGEDNPIRDRLLPRLNRGQVDVTFYAIGGDTIAHSNGIDRPLFATLQNIDALRACLEAANGAGKIITGPDDLPFAPNGLVHFVLHLEGCKPLEGDLASLRTLFRLGVRSAQLTWNVRNDVADGVLETRTGGGLSRFGVEVVREMNRLGMLIDLSHIAEAGFWHAVELSDAPVVVTHANARSVLEHPRNLTDDQLKAVAESGGVVGAHCLPAYVDPDDPTIDRLIDHITHMIDVVGVEHVGLGPDFPTSDGPRPAREQRFPRKHEQLHDLNEIDEISHLVSAMLRRGYGRDEIAAVLGGNFARVLGQVLRTGRTVEL